jgi:hypothetical protein
VRRTKKWREKNEEERCVGCVKGGRNGREKKIKEKKSGWETAWEKAVAASALSVE